MSRAENVVEPKLTKLLNCFLSCKLANFADDIALFSDHQFQQAQDVLRNVEEARRPWLVFYQMQRRQNTCSLTIMLILDSKHETTE